MLKRHQRQELVIWTRKSIWCHLTWLWDNSTSLFVNAFTYVLKTLSFSSWTMSSLQRVQQWEACIKNTTKKTSSCTLLIQTRMFMAIKNDHQTFLCVWCPTSKMHGTHPYIFKKKEDLIINLCVWITEKEGRMKNILKLFV